MIYAISNRSPKQHAEHSNNMHASKAVWTNQGLNADLPESAALLGPLIAAHHQPAAAAAKSVM